MVAQIQTDLHARIPTPNHQNLLSSELLPALVQARVPDGPTEVHHSLERRHHGLGILPGSRDEPPGDVLRLGTVIGPRGAHSPESDHGVELGGGDGLVERGLNVEHVGVIFKVVDELLLGRVSGEVGRKRHQRQLAELLGQVEAEAIVGLELPQRGYAIGSL